MKNPTCIFELLNSDSNELLLYLEPEGSEFRLPPNKSVQIRLFGSVYPIEMKHSVDASGKKVISLWPDRGEFELFFQGQDIWDQLE